MRRHEIPEVGPSAAALRPRPGDDVYVRAKQLAATALQAPGILVRGDRATRLAWGRTLTEQAAELVGRIETVEGHRTPCHLTPCPSPPCGEGGTAQPDTDPSNCGLY